MIMEIYVILPKPIIHELFIDFIKHVVVQPTINAKCKDKRNVYSDYSNKFCGGWVQGAITRPWVGLDFASWDWTPTCCTPRTSWPVNRPTQPSSSSGWPPRSVMHERTMKRSVLSTQFICLSEGVSMMPVTQSPKQSQRDKVLGMRNWIVLTPATSFIFIQTWNQDWNLKLNKTLSIIVVNDKD